MSSYLVELLPELLENILSYCSATDLQNLSCCSSLYRDTCMEILWCSVKIPWSCLMDTEFVSSKKKELENLRFTRVLQLGVIYTNKNRMVYRNMNQQISANFLHILDYCDSDILHTLSIKECPVDILCFKQAYKSLGKLKKLTIKGEEITSRDAFYEIANLCNLVELDLIGTPTGQYHLQNICEKMTNLRSLNISHNEVSDKELLFLTKLTSLEELDISYNINITDLGLSHVGMLLTLKKLRVGCTNITDAGISYLRNLNFLRHVELNDCCITDNGMLELCKLSILKSINVSATNITDYGSRITCKLKSLAELNIGLNKKITDRSLLSLPTIESLRKLNMRNTKITDTAMLRLIPLSKLLKELDISGCYLITDDGIAYVSHMQCLETLDIRLTQVTVVGLKLLTSLRLLRALKCNEDIITDDILPLLSRLQIYSYNNCMISRNWNDPIITAGAG